MHLAIGQIWQETNTLNPVATTRADFESMGVLRGADVLREMRGVNELGGALAEIETWPNPVQLSGLVRLPAWPSGLISRETCDWIVGEVFTAVERLDAVDGVLLALHGAMAADGCPDVEGAVLTGVRERIGEGVPLVASLDLHALVTPAMVAAADALVLYHCAPHIDVFETGGRAARVLRRILAGAQPVTAYQRVPCVLPPENADTQAEEGASPGFKRSLIDLETAPSILSAGIATVQPWMDIPDLGSAVIVVTDGDEATAADECRRLADSLWRQRESYLPELIDIEPAVRAAHQTPGLVVLSDAADATTSGAAGDSVWLLEEILKYDWDRGALVTLVAPELVAAAQCGGCGAEMDVELGGRRDNRFGKTITGRVTVERLFESQFVLNGHIGKNMPIDMGGSAVLRMGTVAIVATTLSGPHFAPELFQAAGFDPFNADLLVAKSPCGFRAVYQNHAAAM
ncbi:MAG: M81 family metallopeptidase, partial [Pirellulaceae bacterium]|nr:M81 family metallopeptidase [Pirellulaceae bacterium]